MDDVLIRAFDRQSQLAMLRTLGSNAGEEQGSRISSREIVDAVVSALGSGPGPQAGLGGLNFQAIVETSIAARLANQLISETAREGPVAKPTDEHVKALEAKIAEQTQRLTAMEMHRLEEVRRQERELSERAMDDVRRRLAEIEVDSKVAMLGSGREASPRYATPPGRPRDDALGYTEPAGSRPSFPQRYTNPPGRKPIYQRYYPAARPLGPSPREGMPAGSPLATSGPAQNRPAHGHPSNRPSEAEAPPS